MIKCFCGKPLHYLDKDIEKVVTNITKDLGEYIKVVYNGKTYLVQRHYIALHGIKGKDLPSLGFKEAKK